MTFIYYLADDLARWDIECDKRIQEIEKQSSYNLEAIEKNTEELEQ